MDSSHDTLMYTYMQSAPDPHCCRQVAMLTQCQLLLLTRAVADEYSAVVHTMSTWVQLLLSSLEVKGGVVV